MSYNLISVQSNIMIKKENIEQMIKKGTSFLLDNHFPWINYSFVYPNNSCKQFFNAWRWEPSFNHNGDIVNLTFLGGPLGKEKDIFQCIASYIEPGSFIVVEGEDHQKWKWVFQKNSCVEESINSIMKEIKFCCFRDIFQNFTESSFLNFPKKDCIEVLGDSSILEGNEKYLCVVVNRKNIYSYELKLMRPYIFKHQNELSFGWIEDGFDIIDNYCNPINGMMQEKYVILFSKYLDEDTDFISENLNKLTI